MMPLLFFSFSVGKIKRSMIFSCHDVSTRHGLCQFNNSGTQKSILCYGIYCDFFTELRLVRMLFNCT
jgi:hypothetical protein